eukprot:gene5327-6643_t
MKSTSIILLIVVLAGIASAKIHFQETFDNDWNSRWVVSNWKQSDGTAGKFVHTAGKWYGSEEDKGIQTSQDARFYAISAKFPSYTNEGKELVLQYTVKHEQKLDCGGAYIKVLPESNNQKEFNGDSEYFIMFGPDICGHNKRTHLIFNYGGKNHLVKREIKVETDQLTHQYTLVLKPDNTYKVLIDNKEVQSGSLTEDWDLLPPKQIKDPKASKPEDWVDEKEINDPTDVKPADWDSIPATISDPEAVKPEDWNDEEDGDWEAPTIANPEYKGVWTAKKIANPEYKGEWEHPMIDNPDYKEDKNLYLYKNIGQVGFELWQVKSGTIFDNILLADSEAEAKEFSEKTFEKIQEAEKAMFDEIESKRQEEEKKKLEEEKKKAEEEKAKKVQEDESEPETLVKEEQAQPKIELNTDSKPAKKAVDHDEL